MYKNYASNDVGRDAQFRKGNVANLGNKWLVNMLILLGILFTGFQSSAQVAVTVTNPTNTTPNLAASYTSLASAVSALQGITAISGPVTLTAAAGAETAPAGGYVINFTAATTATNNVVITGTATTTITAFSPQTSGNINDAIFKIIGSDYVTIQNLTMKENASNTTTAAGTNNMTEFGVALFYSGTTGATANGAQNNTIQNCTISLNRTYLNTFGIYSNTRTTATAMGTAADATASTGSNSGNKFYTNAISNVNYGIVLIGTSTAAAFETGNDIGGSSSGTGNTITNWGGGAATSTYLSLTGNNYCVFSNHQINDNISYNTITSASLAESATPGGILKNYSATSPTSGTIATTINNNTVQVTNNPTATTTGAIIGINNQGLTPLLSTATITMNNNTVQNCVLGGSTSTTNGITGITNLSLAGTVNINSNNILNNSITATTATTAGFTGISNSGAAGTVNINSNIIRGFTNTTQTAFSGFYLGISNSGAVVTALNINTNQIGNSSGGACTYTLAAASAINNAIQNTAGASTCALSINGNSIQGFSLVSASSVTAILNTSGFVGAGTMTINNNNIGTSSGNFLTFSAATSSAIGGISNAGGASGGSLSVQTNDIRGITHSVAGTSAHTYIGNTNTSISTNISSNTFTNLSVNTTNDVTFIGNNITHAASTTHNINSNSVVTAFTKGGTGGNVYFYNSYSSSPSSVTEINNLNNFSNMTFTGATVYGWRSADGTTPGPRKTVTNNTFNNITNNTSGTINSILWVGYSDNTYATNNVSGNTISNITGAGAINGIYSDGQNQNIFGNTVFGISSSGANIVAGVNIAVTGTSTYNFYKNKIYNISGSNAGCIVSGLLVSGSASGATFNVYNNLIGDLRATAATITSPGSAVTGLNLTYTGATSTFNVYNNTVFLNATSTGTNFATSGIFHTVSTTATTSALNLRNNLIVNTSTASGTGLTVAYRRSSGAANSLSNYASTSNNNFFYAGTPSATNLIYADGTSTAQTIAAYKTGVFTAGTVAPRDSSSVSETLTPATYFQSTSGASADFLKYTTSTVTLAESGGANIALVTDDFTGTARNASTPDIGAWELVGAVGAVSNPAAFTAVVAPGANSSSQINLTATANGNGNNIVVITNATGTFTAPTDGTAPGAVGTTLAGSGGTIVYVGSAAGLASHTALTPNTQYFYKAFSYDGSNTYSIGLTGNATTAKIEPSNQPTAFATGTITTSNIPLTWTAAAAGSQLPDGYLIQLNTGSITDPTDFTDIANSAAITSGAANVKVTPGTAASYSSFTGATPGTMYNYKIYSYTNTGSLINWNTTSAPSLSAATKPNAVSGSTFTASSSSTATISWTAPTSYSSANNTILVFVKAGSSITTGTPTNAPSFYSSVSTNLGAPGTAYQNDAAAYCVYKGDGTTVSLTGLTGGATYSVLIYAVVDASNSAGGNSYSSAVSPTAITLAPANDICSGAIVIPTTSFPVLTTAVNNAAATSTNDPIPTCQSNSNKGIWYSFTPATTGTYSFSSCPGGDLDTILSVYTGTCGGTFSSLACSDDVDSIICTNTSNAVITSVSLQAGTTYYIVAYTYSSDTGSIQLQVNTVDPPTITSFAASGCAGSTLVITGTNLSGATSVTIGGTSATIIGSSTATSVSVTVGSGTTGPIVVTCTNGIATSSSNFTVNPLPTATWASSAASVCGSTASQITTLGYTARTNTPDKYSITWNSTPTNSFAAVTDQAQDFSSATGSININVPANAALGTYTGTITVKTANGCQSSATQTFTVAVTSPPLTATGTTICQNASGSLTASAACGSTSSTQTGTGSGGTSEATTYGGSGNTNISIVLPSLPTGAVVTGIATTISFTANSPSFRSDLLVRATPPAAVGAAQSDIQPATNNSSGSISNRAFGTWANANPAGTWLFEFKESFNDSSPNPDANITNVTITVNYTLNGVINWYTSGGTLIGTGSPFNPVGVANSGLADTSTAGSTTYLAACSTYSSCKTPAVFVINPNYTITAPSSVASGTLTPAGATSVSCLGTGSQTYTITPNSGYLISDLTVDGTPGVALTTGSYAAGGTYVFNNVNVNHTINVTYALACINVALSSATATASPICSNGTTTLTYSGLSGTGATLTWYTAPYPSTAGAFSTSTSASGASSAVGPGTYYARATGTCGSPVELQVVVGNGTPAAPTGSLTITNSTCASACTVSGGSIAIGTVSGSGGTLQYSTDNGSTWSATLPAYNAPQTILASVLSSGGCRSTSTTVGTTVAGTCTTPAAPTGSLIITNSTCASACTVSGGSIAIGTVSGSGGTLEYSTDNGSTWNATLPTYNAPQTILASVLSSGGCRSTSTTVGTTVAGTCTTPAAPTGSLAITNSTCASACTVSGGSIAIGTVSGSGGTLEYSTDNGSTWNATLPTYNAPQTILASVINASGCRSTSTTVGTTVAGTCTTPAAPTGSLAITNSTCASACTVSGGSIAIGTVSGSGGTLQYSTDNGSTWNATLPAYNAPQTILASVINASGCRSTSTTVGTTVAGTCTTPAAPTGSLAITNSTCASACTVSGGSIAIGTVSGSGGTLEYSTDNGSTWNSTLPTYNAPQTILASVINASGCRSTSTTVGTTVAGTCTTPTAPTGSLAITNSTCASACTVSGGSIAIGTVSGSGGTLQYSTDNGSTWSATLPSYNAPQTILASVLSSGGCRSTSTTVGTTVAGTCTTPAIPTITSGGPTTFCSGGSVTLTSSAATGYLWSTSATTSSITVTASGSYTVRASNASGCLSAASTPVVVSVTPQLSWYLDADGDHYYTGSAVASCTSPGAGYTTSVLGGGDCDDSNAGIYPGAAEICYNGILENCSGTLSQGCAPVVVNMTPSYNNTTLTSLSQAIPAVAYSYGNFTNLKYRFSITNTTTGVTAADIIQTSRYVTIPASLHSYPGTYTIKASAVINEEIVAYAGNTITVTAPTVQVITLSSANCGATLASLSATLAANAGPNATGYTFRIRTNDANPTPTYATSQSATRYIGANTFTGFPLQYSASYKISVRYTYNDPVTNQPVEAPYGAECTVNTPSIPLTNMASPTCGSQVTAMNANMSAAAASYATSYQFRIRLFSDNSATPTYYYSVPNASRFSSLTAFQGITLAYNTGYSISVQYSVLNGSTTVWSGYGPECKVTTPFFPTTSLVPSQCGQQTATSLTQQLNITPYPGFPNYKVKLDEVSGEDIVNSQEIIVTYPYFKLSQFSIAQLGKNYNVSVAIKLNGVFGDYDTACDLHTPGNNSDGNNGGGSIVKTLVPFKATAYPNPFANDFMIDVKTSSQSIVNLKVYDMIGRMIEQREVKVSDMESTLIGNSYPSGVYNVVVSQDDSVETVRVVKR